MCGKEFQFPHWREKTARFCSKECSNKSHIAKPNVICAICGKPFHRKNSFFKTRKGVLGFTCSKDCFAKMQKIRMTGCGNHQYGIKGKNNASFIDADLTCKNHNLTECLIYVGDWYMHNSRSGRIPVHRYVVELNHDNYDSNFFVEHDGWFYLKREYVVHHKDGNHSNNDINNLQILTRGEHSRLHSLAQPMKRCNITGRFIKL